MAEYQLKGKVLIKGKIVIKTGLAIGGSTTSLDIGGMDNPVIKDAKGIPYIPGSSIKGKIRSLLEKAYYPLRNEFEGDGKGRFHPSRVVHEFKNKKEVDDIIKIFGGTDADEPGRGIFRDAYFDEHYFDEYKAELFKNLELTFTEDKIENTVDRISARANPRHLERVPAGARFDFEIIFDLYSEEDKKLIKVLLQGLKLLEDDYLGGSGSRGSGQINFENIDLLYRPMEYYKTEKEEQELVETSFNLKDIDSDQWVTDVIGKIDL
ncbi:MAG: type III-A CRISPR-associated RAMP protein Csm3 [Candidatus Lokiarchaeota archaeon]|nr:type III-A CRISPR-associated RAMP protein Csm3 [Candidatus Lokiarchaeota archaeon]